MTFPARAFPAHQAKQRPQKTQRLLSPRAVLITGASSGLGAALALHYAAPGVFLALSGRDAARLNETAAACRGQGATVAEKVLDVCDQSGMADWIAAVDAQQPLDLVIANAGISGGGGGVIQGEPTAQARRIFDINLYGVLNTIDPILPRMAARGYGQIALMSSLASFSGWPGAPAYSASKAAVRFYGEALRGAYAERGIQVNVLCPGFVRTALTGVNDFPMPFLMDAAPAARIMAAGLAANKARIAFPLPVYLTSGLLGLLPPALATLLLKKMPKKPATSSTISG